jgi:signal transduction histidine kinase
MKKRRIILASSELKAFVAKLLEPIRRRGKWKWTCVLAILIGVTVAAEAAEPKRILLLQSYGRDFSPFSEFAESFRVELDRKVKEPIDIYEFSLATARFTDENDRPFADYLHTLFENHKLDLVVTVGAPAADFFQKYRQQISPTTPMLLTFLEQRRVPLVSLSANDAVVSNKIDFAGIVDNIVRILPKTNNIVVVLGNTRLERYWLGQLQEIFQPYANRLTFTWLSDLSFEDMLKRSAALPPRSAIFYILLSVDAAGVSHPLGKAVDRLHAVANAPIFSFNDAYFGRGVVGGPMLSVLEFSQKAVNVAVRILNGEAANEMKTEPLGFQTPKYDWREMQRWDIREADLPPGSVVEFRVPTIFEQYKWYIAAGVAIGLIEAIVIIALLLNRRRLVRERIDRQRAEKAARDFSEQLISAQEDERSRLARELHDDVTQRLAVLAIEAGRAQVRGRNQGTDGAMREIREGLVKLSEDVHALSYRLHPSILDDLGLVEALKAECERFSKLESIPVDLEIEDNLVAPTQELALCVFRIAQEALQNVARHARASRAEVSLQRLDKGFRICVRDDGVGFDPKQRRDRPSLGLASMQQRIYLVGGELDVDSAPGHGTIVLAWVPAREERDESRARAAG